jgi:cytidine deaminase
MTEKELCAAAISARQNAYAPYSGYRVGAALLCATGKVYSGCNIENVSYTPTICAERVAVSKAVSDGEREFQMIAVAGGKGDTLQPFPPCGVCRQVLAEFCTPDLPVLLVTGADTYEKTTLGELLPFAFAEGKM